MGAANSQSIEAFVEAHFESKQTAWARRNFKSTIIALAQLLEPSRILEIGGGRHPMLDKEFIERLGTTYVSNDISAHELSLAPKWVSQAHFDVQTPDIQLIAQFANQYDLAFSKMVMEHIESFERAYRNIYSILAPGGVAISYHPLLYTVPFIVNRAIPDSLSSKFLRYVQPERETNDKPKFPAYYSGCAISKKTRERIASFGFRNVWQIPFYGHSYYKRFPVLRNIHAGFTKAVAKADILSLAAYSYTIVQK